MSNDPKSSDNTQLATVEAEGADCTSSSRTLLLPADLQNDFDDDDVESSISPFKKYYEDQSLVDPRKKLILLFGVAASGIVDGFSLADLSEVPFKDVPHILPRRDVF